MPSDWKESSNRRRDARHTKDEPKPRNRGRKKNSRHWCKGKVGVEHQPKCVKYNEYKNQGFGWSQTWRLLICTECGKELKSYFTFGSGREKPDWVDC